MPITKCPVLFWFPQLYAAILLGALVIYASGFLDDNLIGVYVVVFEREVFESPYFFLSSREYHSNYFVSQDDGLKHQHQNAHLTCARTQVWTHDMA